MSLPDAARKLRDQRELHEHEMDVFGAIQRLACIKEEIAYGGETDARVRRLARAYGDVERSKEELLQFEKRMETQYGKETHRLPC